MNLLVDRRDGNHGILHIKKCIQSSSPKMTGCDSLSVILKATRERRQAAKEELSTGKIRAWARLEEVSDHQSTEL